MRVKVKKDDIYKTIIRKIILDFVELGLNNFKDRPKYYNCKIRIY